MRDDFLYMPRYGISVRPDGAVKTSRKGVHFGSITSGGYQVVKTRCGAKMVHRLIAEAFVGPCQPGKQVNHKNGIRDDNRASNLEYMTSSENVRDGRRRQGTRGCNHSPSGKWYAQIWDGERNVHLGMFETEQEAHEAHLAVREERDKEVSFA